MTNENASKPSLGVSKMPPGGFSDDKTPLAKQNKKSSNSLKSSFGFKNPRNYIYVLFVIALLFASVYNIAFWRTISQINDKGNGLSWSLIISTPIIITFLLNAIFLILFSYRYIFKVALSFMFITCALCTYVAWSYGVIFNYDMMVNIYETNVAEASSYFSLKGVIIFIVLGLVPTIALWCLKLYYPTFIRSWILRIGAILLSLAVAGLLILVNYQGLSFVGRENSKLQSHILPTSYVWYTYAYVRDKYLTKPNPPVILGADAKLASTSQKPKLVFLIVGETARAKNYGALGYKRDTNPYTSEQGVINFANVSSCGTATAVSVPCMFSNMNRTEYDKSKLKNRDNLVDVIKKTGANVAWFDNDGGCKAVCDRIPTTDIKPDNPKYCSNGTCHDEVLVPYAKDVAKNVTKDSIFIFHIIGSHGPRYFERFPKEFAKFKPICDRADLENCSFSDLTNTYDNTILYTDYVLSQFINVLKEHQNTNDVALFYVSDHGESLGENGLYLHGTPYSFAPSEQTHVPMQIWLDDNSAKNLKIDKKCLANEAKKQEFSHDNLFHSILGLMQIETKDKNSQLDLFSKCVVKS